MARLSRVRPQGASVLLETAQLDEGAAQLTLRVTARQARGHCPVCRFPTRRIHSDYERPLADRPWAHRRVVFQLQVRTCFCATGRCPRRLFTERLPTVAAPWARRPLRLTQRRVARGLARGGQAGVRVSQRWGLGVSRHTRLRVMRRQPRPGVPTPTVRGVDDWALRKRHPSGTSLADLARRRPIARLSDRDADTRAQWLRDHPGVQIITRDRSKADADGARHGAPAAMPVADRFPLLQHLAEVLAQVFNAQLQALHALNDARHPTPVPQPDGTLAAPGPPPLNPNDAVVQAQQRRARRRATDEQVWAWPRPGATGYAITRPWRSGKSPVFRSLRSATCPERRGRSARGRRVLDPDQSSLRSRWNAGCREA